MMNLSKYTDDELKDMLLGNIVVELKKRGCSIIHKEGGKGYKMKKFILVVMSLMFLFICSSCTKANRVSENIGKEADNFNVTRRITVINMRTDKPIFEMIGNFSLQNNSQNELEIVAELEDGSYKKHFIYLNEYTMYVVEDLSGADVSPYHYEVNFLPEMIKSFTITHNE